MSQASRQPQARPSGALRVWPGGGAARRSAPSPIRSLPRMAPPTRGSGGIAPALQPPPQLRGRPEVRRHGALRAEPGGGGPRPAPTEYDLCPRWPDRPGALRVSSPRRSRLPIPAGPAQHASFRVRRAWPERGTGPHRRCLLNTMSAPDGPTALGHCGYRPCVAAISPAQEPVDPRGAESPAVGVGPARYPCPPSLLHGRSESPPGNTIPAPLPSAHSPRGASPRPKPADDPLPGGYPQGNRSMRGIRRIPCGAPRVQDPGHPPSGPGAVTVAPSDRLRPPRRL